MTYRKSSVRRAGAAILIGAAFSAGAAQGAEPSAWRGGDALLPAGLTTPAPHDAPRWRGIEIPKAGAPILVRRSRDDDDDDDYDDDDDRRPLSLRYLRALEREARRAEEFDGRRHHDRPRRYRDDDDDDRYDDD